MDFLLRPGTHNAPCLEPAPPPPAPPLKELFAFGPAPDLGSTAGGPLSRSLVGMGGRPSGNGYWLVASDGGIFTFGDAPFVGSTGGVSLVSPVVGMAGSLTGRGYRLVAADGGVFCFGDAAFLGRPDAAVLRAGRAVGIATQPAGGGYWVVATR